MALERRVNEYLFHEFGLDDEEDAGRIAKETLVEWTKKVERLVTFYRTRTRDGAPFFLYEAAPPRAIAWPEGFPSPAGLLRFYELCGGGRFGFIDRWLPVEEVPLWTERWCAGLQDDNGRDVLERARHVVFANDADGTPWILDASSGRVASYYFKGGSWEEPQFDGFDEFMDYALSTNLHGENWALAARSIFGEGA